MTAAASATAPEPVGTSRLHTSEPRWPVERPPLDPSARQVLIVAGASVAARGSAAAWTAEAAAAGVTATALDDHRPTLDAALAAATPATRVVVAGDEATIGRVLAAALHSGLVATEVRAQLTDPDGLRAVQCVHCRAVTETASPVDGVCDCSACGRPLLLFPHYSRRLGAYLGFQVDAEELPA